MSFNFERLNVYHLSLSLIDDIYLLTNSLPKSEFYSLTDQARRASTSVCLNIVEGTSGSKKEFKRYLKVSRGSCYELVAILEICQRRDYIKKEVNIKAKEGIVNLVIKINALIKNI